MYGPGDIRFEDVESPRIIQPTDAIIRLAVSSVCGSDLRPYRGLQPIAGPPPMGHEYCGVVEEVGSVVKSIKPGQFVIGSFFASDNTCPHCRHGYQTFWLFCHALAQLCGLGRWSWYVSIAGTAPTLIS